MVRVCTFIHSFKKKKKQKTKKKERKKESALICLYMISYSFGHLYHFLRTIYWVYLSLRVLVRFLWEFLLLVSWDFYAFGVFRYHVRVLWDPSYFGSWLRCIMGGRDEWLLTKVSRSLFSLPLVIWLFLHCIDMGWLSFIFISLWLSMFFHDFFSWYWSCLLFISYIDTHFWFDTLFTLFSYFIDSLTTSHFSFFTIGISFGYF